MGTTPTYGLPYPEATDFVTDGAAAIQALAEETEAELAAAAAAASAAYSKVNVGEVGGIGAAGVTTTEGDIATNLFADPGFTYTLVGSWAALIDITDSTSVWAVRIKLDGVTKFTERIRAAGETQVIPPTILGTGLTGAKTVSVTLQRLTGAGSATTYAGTADSRLTCHFIKESTT